MLIGSHFGELCVRDADGLVAQSILRGSAGSQGVLGPLRRLALEGRGPEGVIGQHKKRLLFLEVAPIAPVKKPVAASVRRRFAVAGVLGLRPGSGRRVGNGHGSPTTGTFCLLARQLGADLQLLATVRTLNDQWLVHVRSPCAAEYGALLVRLGASGPRSREMAAHADTRNVRRLASFPSRSARAPASPIGLFSRFSSVRRASHSAWLRAAAPAGPILLRSRLSEVRADSRPDWAIASAASSNNRQQASSRVASSSHGPITIARAPSARRSRL